MLTFAELTVADNDFKKSEELHLVGKHSVQWKLDTTQVWKLGSKIIPSVAFFMFFLPRHSQPKPTVWIIIFVHSNQRHLEILLECSIGLWNKFPVLQRKHLRYMFILQGIWHDRNIFYVWCGLFICEGSEKCVCVHSTSCKISNLHPWCSQWHLCLFKCFMMTRNYKYLLQMLF